MHGAQDGNMEEMEGQMESDRASNFFRGKALLYGDREEAESAKHES